MDGLGHPVYQGFRRELSGFDGTVHFVEDPLVTKQFFIAISCLVQTVGIEEDGSLRF